MTDATIIEQAYQPEENDQTMRVALLVEYCGLEFHGSQFQPGQVTVQAVLQNALRQLGLSASAVSFASRTDTGVHALGQVAHFDVDAKAMSNIPHLASALNAVLPAQVSVRDSQLNLDRSFNSRRDALAKWYRYKIYNSRNRSVWASKGASTLCRNPLDVERMNQAAQLLLGEHDFASFKDLGSMVTTDLCRLQHAKVMRDGDFIILDIAANRFLYKMVRNIVAQLMVIGSVLRPLPPETVLEVLSARDRQLAPQSAPAEGLTLMAIHYDKPPFKLFEEDVYVHQLKNILKSMESLHNENLFRKAS